MPDVDPVKAKVIVEYDGSGVEAAKKDLASLGEIAGGAAGNAGELGTTISELGDQLEQGTPSIAGFNDALAALKSPIEEGQKAIAQFSEITSASQGAIKDAGTSVQELQSSLEPTIPLLQDASPPMLAIAEHAQSMVTELAPVSDGFVQLSDSLSQAVPMLPQFAESLHEVSASFDPAAYGLNSFAENMSVFQDALGNPEPFSMIQGYLGETGQTWQDFTSSIGENNTAMLENMAQTSSATGQALGNISSDAQSTGKTFTESLNSAQAFTDQFNGLNDAASTTNKTLGETSITMGSVSKAIQEGTASAVLYGEEGSVLKPIGFGEAFGNASEGLMGALQDIAMPLMAVQMIGMAVQAVGQSIYDAAAIAEGPAAHGFGTFTGTVDALGQSAAQAGQQFSEGFGQGVLPALNELNYETTQGQQSMGPFGQSLGLAASTLLSLGQIGTGTDVIGGLEGLANVGAQIIGVQQPFQGPGPAQQQQAQYQQAMANMPQTVTGMGEQLKTQAAQYFQMASDPAYLAAQENLPVALQAYQEAQTKYDSQHAPQTPQQALMGYQAQQYDTQQQQAYQQQMANSPNMLQQATAQLFSGNFGGFGQTMMQNSPLLGGIGSIFGGLGQGVQNIWGGLGAIFNGSALGLPQSSTGGGCFVAGTCVLMADGRERAIETLKTGERVLAHDGKRQLQATITDRMVFAAKQTYRLTFSGGTVLSTTDSHPIATTQGWKSIDPQSTARENPGLPVTTLAVGDSMYTVDAHGRVIRLISIQKDEIVPVYNITVDTAHTYYANGVLVHNAKLDGSGTGTEQTTLSHTFVANVTWEAQNLEKSFTAAAQWAAQNLEKSFTAAAQWASQGLEKAFTAVAQWASQGLQQAFTAVAQWASQGLEQAFTAVAQWASQGLEQGFTAVAQWASQNLQQGFTAVAQWASQGLGHTFTGIASWVGQGLEHTFTGIANWVAQNLTPTFTVNPSVTMLAEGTSNFAGGPAIVGEGGSPEVVEHNGQFSLFNQGATLVNLPQGANVYPMKNLSTGSHPAQFADGTDSGPLIPINLGINALGGGSSVGSIPSSINVYVTLDSQSILSQIGIPMAQNIRVATAIRGF